MIKFMRLDDRLIHGQVATTWVHHVSPQAIVLADDLTAGDPMRRSLQKMSAPKGYPLGIYGVEEAVEKMRGKLAKTEVFLLCANVSAARDLCLALRPESLDLGNLGYKEGYENLMGRLWVSERDKEALSEIQRAGVRVYAQMLPNEPAVDLPSL